MKIYFRSSTEMIIEYLFYFFKKIFPRIAICAFAAFIVLKGWLLTTEGAYWAFIIALILIFAKFPPSIDTLYLVQKSETEAERHKIFIELLKLSKDFTEGYDSFETSYVIKGITKLGMIRIYNILQKKHDFSNHEKIYHVKSKKEYNDHLKMLAGK